jgi:hypothetical protein
MNDEPMTCDHVEELAPELALEIAAGPERDAALQHVAGCASCRRTVSDLTSVGEDLLLLAPPREPPAGFDDRVLLRLAPPAPSEGRAPAPARATPRRWLRGLAAVAAVFLAATIAAGSVYVATSDDRRLAGTYRGILGEAGGSYFAVAPITDGGRRVGTVFGYQGDPSWIFVSLSGEDAGRFVVRLETRSGDVIELGDAVIGGDHPGWGRSIPVRLADVRAVRLSGPDGYLVAALDGSDPWR